MLVRVDWSPRDDLPDVFDEHVAKKYPTVKETWEELAVVWRASGQIELWSEHVSPLPSTAHSNMSKLLTAFCITRVSISLPVSSIGKSSRASSR